MNIVRSMPSLTRTWTVPLLGLSRPRVVSEGMLCI